MLELRVSVQDGQINFAGDGELSKICDAFDTNDFNAPNYSFSLTSVTGEMAIHAHQIPAFSGITWSIGVSSVNEDTPFPSWETSMIEEMGSPCLVIRCPNDTVLDVI